MCRGFVHSNMVMGIWVKRENNSDHRSGELHGEGGFDRNFRDKGLFQVHGWGGEGRPTRRPALPQHRGGSTEMWFENCAQRGMANLQESVKNLASVIIIIVMKYRNMRGPRATNSKPLLLENKSLLCWRG